MSKRQSTAAAIVLLVPAFVLAAAGTAGAEPGSGQGKGRTESSQTTEDNDRDGVPNTPDPDGDSDNRHPSGRDKHAEGGNSGNQGRSGSTPDQDGRGPERDEGGTDKPDGTGGRDELDQDGNNGCGNDDDFDDDNEGLCGGPERVSIAPTSPTQVPEDDQQARSDAIVRSANEGRVRAAGSDVLAVRATADNGAEAEVLGAALARTGLPLAAVFLAAAALIGSGALLKRRVDRAS